MSLIDKLKENRPNLSPSTLYSYSTSLHSLYKKVFNSNDIDIEKFNESEKILKYLEEKEPSKRKTVLAILFVLTGLKQYQQQMENDIKSYQQEINKQIMNTKQQQNFKTQEEIKLKWEELKQIADHLYKKKTQLTNKEKQEIQNFVILSLVSGIFIAPRRSKDFCDFKWRNPDENCNYLKKNEFVFTSFKNSKSKGSQTIVCPNELKKILTKWMSVNESDYLLVDVNGQPLNSVKLNQRMNKIFGGNVAINVMRHSFLSTKFQDTIKVNEELNDTMEAMGSSSNQKNIYIQKL